MSSQQSPKKILVTSALPYGNGHLHLGHLVEHIQTDIWVRTQRLLGHECIAICGDDAHGTPIMLKAEQLGMTPEALTAEVRASHEQDFKAFSIHYDQYYTTHSPENQTLANTIYERLDARGDIAKKSILQAYDPVKKLFLPDRYVKGTCPKCSALDQYGDNCEVCGATYSPTDLINPVSAISGVTPIEKESVHYFFDLPRYEAMLHAWINQGHLQSEVVNKLDEWFSQGLKAWDISRDAPYFGFLIPGTDDKYFYVWLDAPIGYMASVMKFCETHDRQFDEFWAPESEVELIHFVGKDIVYFHALFWPAMLSGAGYRLPTAIYAHGFLTVSGQKMSKSRGTFIEARAYIAHLNPEYLRYYFATKMNGRLEDLDLNLDDFIQRVNSDLVGKIVNIASRCAGFIQKNFHNQLAAAMHEPSLYQTLLAEKESISTAYNERDYARAIRQIMELADRVNQYIDQQKPWILAKEPDNLPTVQAVCTTGLNCFAVLMAYLSPVLPHMASQVVLFLNIPALTWDTIQTPLLNHTIHDFIPLMRRVERDQVNAMLASSSASLE